MKIKSIAICMMLALLAIGTAVQAGTTSSALSFTGDGYSYYASFSNTSQTVGWGFTTKAAINVTALGVYDLGSNGLGASHQVGIWNSSGTLLASTTVDNTGTLNAGFRYAAISPVSLVTGQTYNIGYTVWDGNPDDYYTSATSITVDPSITFEGARTNSDSGGFSNPSITSTANGRFGPNFKFTTGSPAAVPEASTLFGFGSALVMAGPGMIGWLRRRRA